MPLQYPLINGTRFDFSSVQLSVPGIGRVFEGVKSITYSDELNPGKLRGTRSQVIGRTRGQYEASGSLEMYASEAQSFIDALGPGYMERVFLVNIGYSEPSMADLTYADQLVGCRIKKVENSGNEGEEGLAIKFDLDVMHIVRNGKVPVSPPQFTP